MKLPTLLLSASAAANLCLAALLFSHRSGASASTTEEVPTSPIAVGSSGASAATSADRPADPAVDDATYVAQLRADGFPPPIIRTLIYARLEQRYAERIRSLRDKAENTYWRSSNMGGFYGNLTPEERAASRAMHKQMSAEVKALLGDGDEALHPWEKDRRERTMGNLSSEKVRQIEAINTDYNEMSALARDRSKGVLLKADKERLRLLEKEKRADLAAVLTPEELVEYDLRGSPTASSVRSRLRNFEPTEAEYRALTSLYLEIDLKYGMPSYLTAQDQALRQAEEKNLPGKIQAVLSPERYAEYKIVTDGAYRETTSFLTSANLDPKLARDVLGVKQDLVRRADAIRDDAALTAEQKNVQLAALGKEADTRLTATLGDSKFAAYKKSIGSWMTRMNPKPATPPRP